MKNHAYQVQYMLADELDAYSRQGNHYMNDNTKEIQELYKDRDQMKNTNQEQVEDKEVILIKPYEISFFSLLITSPINGSGILSLIVT